MAKLSGRPGAVRFARPLDAPRGLAFQVVRARTPTVSPNLSLNCAPLRSGRLQERNRNKTIAPGSEKNRRFPRAENESGGRGIRALLRGKRNHMRFGSFHRNPLTPLGFDSAPVRCIPFQSGSVAQSWGHLGATRRAALSFGAAERARLLRQRPASGHAGSEGYAACQTSTAHHPARPPKLPLYGQLSPCGWHRVPRFGTNQGQPALSTPA